MDKEKEDWCIECKVEELYERILEINLKMAELKLEFVRVSNLIKERELLNG